MSEFDMPDEHEGWVCSECGSDWIRWEHLDGKDCEVDCNDPCTLRMCNEEDCIGEAVQLCEMCESNPKENAEGKWCTSCRDEFKESDND